MKELNKSYRKTLSFLRKHGCAPVKGQCGQHYHFHSGFFMTPKNNLMYWMSSDDRWSDVILFRTAKDLKDFTGGPNQYPQNDIEFDNMIKLVDR